MTSASICPVMKIEDPRLLPEYLTKPHPICPKSRYALKTPFHPVLIGSLLFLSAQPFSLTAEQPDTPRVANPRAVSAEDKKPDDKKPDNKKSGDKGDKKEEKKEEKPKPGQPKPYKDVIT